MVQGVGLPKQASKLGLLGALGIQALQGGHRRSQGVEKDQFEKLP